MVARCYSGWEAFRFPGPAASPGPVALSADLSPASVLAAFRRGIMPMPAPGEVYRTINEHKYRDQVAAGAIAIVGDEAGDPYQATWWSPDPRAVIGPGGVHLGRNARKALRRNDGLTTTADTVFTRVAEECRAGREPRWLTNDLLAALAELHRQGWAHSIEVWLGSDLVGGAIGIAGSAVISGDSLFSRQPCAAAVAVSDMQARLAAAGGTHIDAQWDSPLLRSLGAQPIPRAHYLDLLGQSPQPLPLPREPLPARRLLPA